ncbi:hypothetical protein [Streptomyces sp. NPDC057580]|uniref:hypothetical protein n=1 Tax=Streptomyces sp. NPDC057580 TaxID=3346173 RepID=UPI0036CDD05E
MSEDAGLVVAGSGVAGLMAACAAAYVLPDVVVASDALRALLSDRSAEHKAVFGERDATALKARPSQL